MKLCYKCRQEIKGDTPVKHGLHPDCFNQWFDLPPEAEEDFKNLSLKPELSETATRVMESFYHGNFKKYSATLGGKSYILKIPHEDPNLAKSEYLCNQIASSLGLTVPKYFLIQFMDQEDCFLSYNFMQDYEAATLKHIYHYLKPEEEFSVVMLIKVIEAQTGRLSEVKKFINLCLFDALIGNHDRHGRNLGLIITAYKKVLSPCYDNPSYLGLEDEKYIAAHHEPRGKIFTESSKEPVMKAYAQEFIHLGYKESLKEFFGKIDTSQLEKLIEDAFLSQKRKTAFNTLMTRRYGELRDALKYRLYPD